MLLPVERCRPCQLRPHEAFYRLGAYFAATFAALTEPLCSPPCCWRRTLVGRNGSRADRNPQTLWSRSPRPCAVVSQLFDRDSCERMLSKVSDRDHCAASAAACLSRGDARKRVGMPIRAGACCREMSVRSASTFSCCTRVRRRDGSRGCCRTGRAAHAHPTDRHLPPPLMSRPIIPGFRQHGPG
jgi:hypothetical protein